MRYSTHIVLIIFSLALFGCFSNIKSNHAELENMEQELLQQIAQQPENIDLLGSAGDFFRKKYDITNNISDAEKSEKYYSDFLYHQPQHTNARILLYQLYYTMLLNNHLMTIEKAYTQFEKIQQAEIKETINPPELAEAINLLFYKEKNQEDVRPLVLKGLKRSPKSAGSYLLLSRINNDLGNYSSTIALLKNGIKKIPDNFSLLHTLGQTYTLKAKKDACQFENIRNWENAVEYYSRAKKINPDDEHIRSTLFFAYFALNKRLLGLQEAKKAYELFPSEETLLDLSVAYVMNYQSEKIGELLASRNDIDPLILAQHHLRSGKWAKAFEYYQSFELSDEYDVYDAIQKSVSAKLSGAEWTPTFNQKAGNYSPWETSLADFWQGKISSQELISFADNKCKKIEANTYIGFMHFANKDFSTAEPFLKQALSINIPLFVEDGIAKNLLKEIALRN